MSRDQTPRNEGLGTLGLPEFLEHHAKLGMMSYLLRGILADAMASGFWRGKDTHLPGTIPDKKLRLFL
jgi:hypothetical protein